AGSEDRKLKGEILSFPERPNEGQIIDHLIGRRVICGLRMREPAYWDRLVCGERVVEEAKLISGGVWDQIRSEQVRVLFNQLNRYMADKELGEMHEADTLTPQERMAYRNAKDNAQPLVRKLAKALETEPENVRLGFVPYLRFWEADFSQVNWFSASKAAGKREQNLKQTLLLLGIRKDDIQDDNPANWKLLLPEERAWLRGLVE